MDGERTEGPGRGLRATLITSLPVATAIGVFGVVFGVAASAALDPLLVVGMFAHCRCVSWPVLAATS